MYLVSLCSNTWAEKEIITALNLQVVICGFDQALYSEVEQVIWQNQEAFQKRDFVNGNLSHYMESSVYPR